MFVDHQSYQLKMKFVKLELLRKQLKITCQEHYDHNMPQCSRKVDQNHSSNLSTHSYLEKLKLGEVEVGSNISQNHLKLCQVEIR